MFGYIYIRENEYWSKYNCVKLGKTENIPNREQTYITSEINRGKFIFVFKVSIEELDNIEKMLQKYFNDLQLNVTYDAGKEFYNYKIIDLIIPYLERNKIDYYKLSENEINNLIRKYNEKIPNKSLLTIVPKKYQEEIIDKAFDFFISNEKGILILPCGAGKTLISLWIAYEFNMNRILIGVPNKELLNQWKKSIQTIFNFNFLLVYDDVNIEEITTFLKENKKCIIITTYRSSFKVEEAIKDIDYKFNIKILDEVHHITTTELKETKNKKSNIRILNIPSKKQLSLTATLKNSDSISENIVSNNSKKYFGEIIEEKSLLWSIQNNIICDYVVQTIITDEIQLVEQLNLFNIEDDTDKRLFFSAYASLKSINDKNSHHLLIYSNKKESSIKLIKFIKILLDNKYFNIENLYYSEYFGDMSLKEQTNKLSLFETSKFGIISCVYCLGEGWDFPLLDGVVFSENMLSEIRIVQSCLRSNRLDKNDPYKKSKIILPVVIKDDLLNDNKSDFQKVREIIYRLGLEDETICQKIKVLKVNIEKQSSETKLKQKHDIEFGEYDETLTENLRLKTIKRSNMDITYKKAKEINNSKNIKTKEDYYKECEIDTRLPQEPEIYYKDLFISWIDYLNIKQKNYYNFETCKEKVDKYLLLYPEIKKDYLDLSSISNELCKIDSLFPPHGLWVEYYNVNKLEDIINIKNNKKSKGCIT